VSPVRRPHDLPDRFFAPYNRFSATNAALDLQQAAIAPAHHGNIGPSGRLLAQRRLAVTRHGGLGEAGIRRKLVQ
jgi:hypothetical protein